MAALFPVTVTERADETDCVGNPRRCKRNASHRANAPLEGKTQTNLGWLIPSKLPICVLFCLGFKYMLPWFGWLKLIPRSDTFSWQVLTQLDRQERRLGANLKEMVPPSEPWQAARTRGLNPARTNKVSQTSYEHDQRVERSTAGHRSILPHLFYLFRTTEMSLMVLSLGTGAASTPGTPATLIDSPVTPGATMRAQSGGHWLGSRLPRTGGEERESKNCV